MLVLSEITKEYGTDGKTFRALDKVSLEFPSKGFVAILGPSGCGKTTLLNILGGLDRPTAGHLYVDGKDTADFSSKDFDYFRNQYVGFIFQDYNLLGEMTALANVKMALDIRRMSEAEAKRKALEALRAVDLYSKADNKPKELSGGQKQRVAIARAIVTSPKILLADEPTGALDSKSGNDVMAILKYISKSILVIMVTHNEELAKSYADRIIQMKDGVINEDSLTIKGKDNPLALKEEKKPENYSLNDKKIGLGIKGAILTGFRHTLNKIGRSLTVAITMMFGILALGFSLALINGFGSYVDRINHQTGGQAPIVISAISQDSGGPSFNDFNQTESFPSEEEIYPFYSPKGSFSYKYNNFSNKFFDYVKEMKKEGILSDYVLKRSSDNGLNVITDEPKPLNSSLADDGGGYVQVRVGTGSPMASGTGGNLYVANTIFHPLLDNYEDYYDLIDGKLPTNKNELVMIVDYRNAVSFNTLQKLGYYNSLDVQEDILDPSLVSKVKPISFSDIIGKEYKIYTADSSYEKVSSVIENSDPSTIKNTESFPASENITDDDGNERNLVRYIPKTAKELYNQDPKEDNDEGFVSKVVGIIRPKQDVRRGNMSSGIGYLPDKNEVEPEGLAETIRAMNSKGSFLSDFKNAFLRKMPMVNDENGNYVAQKSVTTLEMAQQLIKELSDADGNIRSDITSDEVQSLYETYFTAYYIASSDFDPRSDSFIGQDGKPITDESKLYPYKAYSFLSSYFSEASELGLDFSDQDLNGISFDDPSALKKYFDKISTLYNQNDVEGLYDSFLALGQLLYGYASVTDVVLMPNSISQAKDVLARLNEFNDFSKYDSSLPNGDPNHAKDMSEVVTFSSSIFDMTADIGQAIDMTNIILEVFAVITLIGSGVVCISVTNMSVLERTREIGILRALGASKKDVGFIFESESFVVGIAGGLLGCLATYIVSFPINNLINSFYPGYQVENIAAMAWWHPLVLIPLAVLVTMLSALIPSLHAANKKPVLCLRNDQ